MRRIEMAEQKRHLEVGTFAGGCFWCLQADFEKLPGVVKAVSGYTGEETEAPSYEEKYAPESRGTSKRCRSPTIPHR